MPYRVCKTIEIENGHMLSKHPDKCRFPHGHTRRVEIILEADDLDANGMVCDFKIVKTAIGEYLETLKAAYGDRVIGFVSTEPTTEVLAKTFFDACIAGFANYRASSECRYPLRSQVRIVAVRVWETSSSWAEYASG